VAIYVTGIIFGMTILPVIPLCLSFSVEVTFPLNTATSNSVIVLFGQTGAFFISILGSEITKQNFKKDITIDVRTASEQDGARRIMLILQITALAGLIISLFVKEDLRRSRYDENKQTKFEEMKEKDTHTEDTEV
jgi:predicted histidine transporter YuiF (NhaC family)